MPFSMYFLPTMKFSYATTVITFRFYIYRILFYSTICLPILPVVHTALLLSSTESSPGSLNENYEGLIIISFYFHPFLQMFKKTVSFGFNLKL